MDGTDINEVGVSRTTEESPESTVEINVKTLDAQTYTLKVNKYMPVPVLKEQIANITGILSGQQRLICQGKVLKDDQLLSAYHVEDGHTLHLVVRQPPPSSIASSVRLDDIPSHSGSISGLNPMHSSLGQSLLFGAVNLADTGDANTSDLNQVLSALFNSFGLNNIGAASERPDSRVVTNMMIVIITFVDLNNDILNNNNYFMQDSNYGRPERTSETSQIAARPDLSPHLNAIRSQNVHFLGQQHPMVIPDSLTTLSQFLSHLRHQFDVRDHVLGGGNDIASLDVLSEQRGLPTPARLSEILLSVRQLLMEVGGSLYDLAKHLEEQATVTDPLARARIQSRAVRFGGLFQNFGSLLLELGRTVTTLRMGQTPSEAVVNAGPAIFVSSAAATPLMVQAGPSFSGVPLGNQHLNHGSGLLAGNINIRIHRGPSAAAASAATAASASGQPSERQPSVATEATRASAENLVQQILGGLPEPSPRVVPLRTVVAVPAGIARPRSDSSGSVGLVYPLYTGFHQRVPGTVNDARISQAPSGTTQETSAARASTSSSGDDAAVAPAGDHNARQDAATPVQADGDGLFFSAILRQLMPLISPNGSDLVASSSAGQDQAPSNTPEERESKRLKRE